MQRVGAIKETRRDGCDFIIVKIEGNIFGRGTVEEIERHRTDGITLKINFDKFCF